jgi:hypothetical protein
MRSSILYGEKKSEDGKGETIKMAALGRRFQLGTIYDYTSDKIIAGIKK